MPSLGPPELLIILVIVIIVFGVGRLPEVGGAMGKAIREFRQSSQGLDEEKKSEEEKKEEA
jgi:sec-independent protein translocase protein TatA